VAIAMSDGTSPEVVIFDFDGTIVDSMPFLTQVATELLSERYGMTPEEAGRAYVDTCGLPFVQQIEIIWPGDNRNPETVEAFESRKRRQLLNFGLFPDVVQTLSKVRSHGMKVCVSSGSIQELIVRLLKRRNLVVDLVMGYRPGFEKGLDHFEFARRSFDSTFDHLVFIGDSERDGLTASRAGVRFIARAGLLTADELKRLLPDVPVVDSLEEILPLLGIKKPKRTLGSAHPPGLFRN
jgi:phosphoglycolate phosphatase-like HAD superfamily hydrolase